MAGKPLIGVMTRLDLTAGRLYLDRRYCDAIEACGGLPVMLPLMPEGRSISGIVEKIDGLLLPGSNTDVDPAFFGEEPHPGLRTVIPDKDNSDMEAIKAARGRRLPVLGICYGMQALNVALGGSVFQDLSSAGFNEIKHDQGPPYERNSHSVSIVKGSMLSGFDSIKDHGLRIRVNSSHHQAAKKLGEGLVSAAVAPDGVIEAVEGTDPDWWVLGVQWHPEMTFAADAVSREIFGKFVKASH